MRFIATRNLFAQVNDKIVGIKVSLGEPRLDGAGTWVCEIHISGDASISLSAEPGFGQDGIQALMMALRSVAVTLDRSGFDWVLDPDIIDMGPSGNPLLREDFFPRKIICKVPVGG
jgi:hypothetical protein